MTVHQVAGIDSSAAKVESIRQRRAPFYEPGLEAIIEETVSTGRLTATSDLVEALQDADVALLCVGTPSENNGNLDLQYIRRVATEIGDHLEGRAKPRERKSPKGLYLLPARAYVQRISVDPETHRAARPQEPEEYLWMRSPS